MNRKLIAIVPAAGVGARAQTTIPKQYQHIHGQPILRLAVAALLADARISQVRVAVAPGDHHAQDALHGLPRTVWRECGGPTRAETVAAALADARLDAGLSDDDWVLVHDAARPGLPADALDRLISTCQRTGHGGLLAIRVPDTVKQEKKKNDRSLPGPGLQPAVEKATFFSVRTSVPREGLWLAQTPQMFPAGRLDQALTAALQAGHEITDEASALEWAGYSPLLVPGSVRNFKVTWPEDAELMAKWL